MVLTGLRARRPVVVDRDIRVSVVRSEFFDGDDGAQEGTREGSEDEAALCS